MIPSVLARQVRQGVEDFLETTFPVSTPLFADMLGKLLHDDGGVFKGPYLSIDLPFLRGDPDARHFEALDLGFTPYLHQERAFKRLAGARPRSTLVATGTGSGKTECFLFPILDHCLRHREQRGIKAIIIYPMNALATDQAGRIARAIHGDPALKGKVTAGLFIGQSDASPVKTMTPDSVITCKKTQRLSPPDILLTNYKMLDYLLVRPKDQVLWQHNGPETLRYLVVDELHTFDGAQGTDLACLLRRLKDRLKASRGATCCVGTSATLGGPGNVRELCSYAEQIFDEDFDEQSVITEARQSPGEFLADAMDERFDLPLPDDSLSPDSFDSDAAYLSAQHQAWFRQTISPESLDQPGWRLRLADQLKSHVLFQNLLKALGGKPTLLEDLVTRLGKSTPGMQKLDAAAIQSLLLSLLSLVSAARVSAGSSGRLLPFLNVRLQLWLRELRRMVASVSATPALRFADDLNEQQLRAHLPVVHCHSCGSMGWAGTKKTHDSLVNSDLQKFYIAYFGGGTNTVFMFPEGDEHETREMEALPSQICPSCMNLVARQDDDTCPDCGERGSLPVLVPNNRAKKKGKFVGTRDCPYCGAGDGLAVVGSRAASLTSVLVAQLFSSPYNDDKKLLAFSDSVQDAAHRAGFFSARTYRFNLRAALQQFVHEQLTAAPDAALSLDRVSAAFCEHWRARLGDLGFVSTFLAPNMSHFEDWNAVLASGELPEGSTLVDDVVHRVDWEVFAEYGFNCRIGRTLEKTSSSVVGHDPRLLDQVCARLLPTLQNEVGPLRKLDLRGLRRFVFGFVEHLKSQGGIVHPVLQGYIEDQAKTYLLNRIPWMARFNPYGRAPVFLTSRPIQRFDSLLNPAARSPTWAQLWAEKCFSALNFTISSEIPTLYELVLPALVEAGLMVEIAKGSDRVWGLAPDKLQLQLKVAQLRCVRCGHNVSVPEREATTWAETPCLRFHCRGHYAAQGDGSNYYGKLYATGDVQRVFTAEHTGLLDREEREEIERQFKMDRALRKPWYPNLLSCTPTLEMGIDIGDLSSLILCSVPPRQSSYVQRTGRSGRRDGNALNLTVANARPHDLFFFAEPTEMIAGQVDPPGVFLGASAVLERQLVAHCFDRWAQSGIDTGAIPPRLSVALGQLEPADPTRFPHSLVHFVDLHRTEILERFLQMFGIDDARMVAHLTGFIGGDRGQQGSLCYRILDGLHRVQKQKASLESKVRLLNERIKRKQESPAKDENHEQELGDLKREKSGLQSLAISLGKRDVLNFFSDEGLLPNYAFPEAGVSLRSVIYRRRRKPKVGESNYENLVFDYERPAQSAISELAPANTFYAGSRKVQIDQVDMTSSEIETWRLCRECSHAELMGTGDPQPTCPRCGDALWADEGRRVQMLRMRQVIATTSDKESRIGDDSDDREPTFYNKQMLVDVDPADISRAFAIDDDELPFGFEFLSKATFREINFGAKGDSGPTLCVAGVDNPRQGFKLCAVCGKVQPRGNKKDDAKPEHSYTCTARRPDAPDTLVDCVYLYRHFSSEAIRILLPVTTFAGSDEKLHSFVAALHLGLKRRFRGNIDHLQTAVQDEPVAGSNYRKRYLVLYDTVPGGTGYLKQLMLSPAELMEVFAAALDHMNACACQHDLSKDGCYRCLYAYRHSYEMKQTSRRAAVALFSEILKRRDSLKEVETLKGVQVNSLFDSELEARFVEALRRSSGKDTRVKLKKDVVHGKPGYFVRCGEQSYYIEPQVQVGPVDGVAIGSKIDFVFWPATKAAERLPIAVFTDGFAWHKDRVGLDLAQRMALARSGHYRVWSLTYQDVENCFKNQGAYYDEDLASTLEMKSFAEHFGLASALGLEKQGSFEWLVRYLCHPDDGLWQRLAFVQGLLKLQKNACTTPTQRKKWAASLSACAPGSVADALGPVEADRLIGVMRRPETGDAYLQLHLAVPPGAVSAGQLDQLHVVVWLDDGPEVRKRRDFASIWNGVLRLYNLFQFLPRTVFVATTGLAQSIYDGIDFAGAGVGAPAATEAELTWRELRDFAVAEIHPLLDAVHDASWPPPEVPAYELQSARGAVVAEAELAWPERKLAVLTADQLGGRAHFEQAGWTVVAAAEALADPATFVRNHGPRRPR